MRVVKLNKYSGSTTKMNFHNEVPYLSFRALDKYLWLNNGFTTRLGGVSSGFLSSMNLGFGRGDTEENVVQNHEIIADTMGFLAKDIVATHQTHTTNIRVVTKDDCGKGLYKPRDYENIDGIITNEPGVILAAYFADCVPLYIVDTKNKVIGLSHSGWRGTVGKIGKKTIELMRETFGSKPEDITACIGPSICQKCYEISRDVAKEFTDVFSGNVKDILVDKGNDKYLLDLWRCNQLIFQEAGVLSENIHTTDICTCCNPDTLYSHRGHNGKRGNMAAFLSIKQERFEK